MRTRVFTAFTVLLVLCTVLAGCVPQAALTPGAPGVEPAAQRVIDTQIPVEIPRDQVFVIDQIFRYSVVNNFNLFVSGPPSPTRQGLIFDTLWYLDQQTGEWIDSLAAEPPEYSDDFTQMTVKLREGVYWSDDTPFTADDVVFTVDMLKANPGMLWSAEMSLYVESVEKTDDYTVVFTLKEPNPRFHAFFTSRYNALFIVPRHVWEQVEDPKTFDFFPPVSLGAYVFQDADPNGYWELYKLRDDWQRAAPGIITGKAGPGYILTIFYGGSERKIIAMARHDLDIFMDVDYEAFQALLDSTPTARSWFEAFPWAYPNELDARFYGFNYTIPPYDNKDVRWALTLALDIVELQTEYIGGVTRVTPIPVPATDLHMGIYHVPLEPWLQELTIDIGGGETFQPFDPTVPQRIAEWAREQGYDVPDDPEGLRDRFGFGWWKHAPDVAETLLVNNGFSRDADGSWLLPDGTPWKIAVTDINDTGHHQFKNGNAAVQQWKKFGIDAEYIATDAYTTLQQMGDFQVGAVWPALEPWGAGADLYRSLDIFASELVAPVGETNRGHASRWSSPEMDDIIRRMRATDPTDIEATVAVCTEALQLLLEELPSFPTYGYSGFMTWDEFYWTNWPGSENPYMGPYGHWGTLKYMLPFLQPTGK